MESYENVLGVLDGGQLGMFTCRKAREMGIRTVVFTNDCDGCATRFADKLIVGSYDNEMLLRDFARATYGGVITTAFEQVPSASLEYLRGLRGTMVRPPPEVQAVAQHRLREKDFVCSLGIPTTPYTSLKNFLTIEESDRERYFPGLLKTCCDGYDGQKQWLMKSTEDARAASEAAKTTECIIEEFVPDLDYEISVIVARKEDGETLIFPPVKNVHRDGILRETHHVPGLIPEDVQKRAIAAATKITHHLEVIGSLAVEFFVTKSGEVLFNEMAPRPHNSGHWTIEGCKVSQYEALIRAIFGLPFPRSVEPIAEARMINLIGPEIAAIGDYERLGWSAHGYGKGQVRPKRKMGHVTLVGSPALSAIKQRLLA